MRGRWIGGLTVALGVWSGLAQASEGAWQPGVEQPIATSCPSPPPIRPITPPMNDSVIARSASEPPPPPPPIFLGRPVPLRDASPSGPSPIVDRRLTTVAYTPDANDRRLTTVAYTPDANGLILRGQAPPPQPPPVGYPTSPPAFVPPAGGGVAPPAPALPPASIPPPIGDEPFNAGAVAPAGPGVWDRMRDYFTGPTGGPFMNCNRALFQSDHAFDEFISPVTNPFLFEDPRSLTEIRPIFMIQSTPSSNWLYGHGNAEFLGLQARLAITDRLSFVMNKLGWVWLNPETPVNQFTSSGGFSEIWLGPKYTFLRNEQTKTLGAAGLTFQIPSGPNRVFQDTGNLSLTPYVTMGQNFLKSSWGSFNALGSGGYCFSVNNQRSEYLFANLHLDYDIGNWHKIYPLIEMNWMHYTKSGTSNNIGFEGGDLVNYGSQGVAGQDNLILAFGTRYKVSEALQFGTAFQWAVTGDQGINSFRWTVDMIIRY